MREPHRRSVAVIGDGALPSGIVFEAMNNAGELNQDLLVVLNDNKMSICPRVGSVASYLDRLRSNPYYTGFKSEVTKILSKVPVLGDPAERFLAQVKEGMKAGLIGGMVFEEFGFRYLGPIDGHDLPLLRKYLQMIKEIHGPVLLHIVTEKGHGYQPAAEDPVLFHTPPAFVEEGGKPKWVSGSGQPAFTNFARDAIASQMRKNDRITVLTAAMCQGNKLEPVRDEFPKRFFDVGICESHAVAFAAGQAKAGMRPIVAIYSTFLQRSFDQIFQEVSLQNLPVVFMMDRAGLAGPDGPTHHGVFDIPYMRLFPNLIILAPADQSEVEPMLEFALKQQQPVAIRYPKATAQRFERPAQPIELGKAQTMREGTCGAIVACGAMVEQSLEAARRLESEGLSVAVINARFIKPLDTNLLSQLFAHCNWVLTVEEGARMGGFGSAVGEAAVDHGWDARKLRSLAIPDRYIEHGDRGQLLEEIGLDPDGIVRAALEMHERARQISGKSTIEQAAVDAV
jgi:1-deoxy-D-xylulose-5-phosphate synthase